MAARGDIFEFIGQVYDCFMEWRSLTTYFIDDIVSLYKNSGENGFLCVPWLRLRFRPGLYHPDDLSNAKCIPFLGSCFFYLNKLYF